MLKTKDWSKVSASHSILVLSGRYLCHELLQLHNVRILSVTCIQYLD